ncbi:MAG TPA: hypothetical protein PKE06_14585, partial [Flavilitoribacter sp.]|nr:hypothetical protein [Flavilitoribacter sp.]HMQ86366.1 hypothetical protein [Flavilitoribacter sp.]
RTGPRLRYDFGGRGRAFVETSAGGERKLGSSAFAATQPGIIATIYLSPIALLKIKHPMLLRWSVNQSPLFHSTPVHSKGRFFLCYIPAY